MASLKVEGMLKYRELKSQGPLYFQPALKPSSTVTTATVSGFNIVDTYSQQEQNNHE